MTLTTLRTPQRQIRAEVNHFLNSKLFLTRGAITQVRQKTFELQQPHFKITQHRVEIVRRLRSRFEASERHAKQIVVCLMWRREVDEQVAHIREARQYGCIRGKVK